MHEAEVLSGRPREATESFEREVIRNCYTETSFNEKNPIPVDWPENAVPGIRSVQEIFQ